MRCKFAPKLKMMDTQNNKIEMYSTTSIEGLTKLEAKYRTSNTFELLPLARGTSYTELATQVLKDKDATVEKPIVNKLFTVKTTHVVRIGLHALLSKVRDYLKIMEEEYPMDILSISGGQENTKMIVIILIRVYGDTLPNFESLYDFLAENKVTSEEVDSTKRLNVETLEKIEYSQEEIAKHDITVKSQNEIYINATEEKPFLNSIKKYTKRELPQYDEDKPLLYLLEEKERKLPTILRYEEFNSIFREAVSYITSINRDSYYNVLKKRESKKNFMADVQDYIVNTFVIKRKILPTEDVPTLVKKIENALFELYIVQTLIDDPQITDIKITDPYSIRVRIKGKAYLSDITFLNDDDYIRFVNMLIIRNNIDTSVPEQTFTDDNDETNILRFTITMPYISSNGYPVLHIRKIARKKMLSEDLIKAGMFDEKIKDYLLDCGKYSTGVVFAGAPGSGKTICLNWFLEEAYEDSAEILVIQENDELFTYKKGVIFQHIVNNPVDGQKSCSLEDLGELALVAGANVFIIGEVKGAEICSAITLANSGCRTAITVHSRSSTETIDKMADLAMRGIAKDFEQAKRMLKCFQTIVYLENFQVQEITEIIGYDEGKKKMIYKPIYRKQDR